MSASCIIPARGNSQRLPGKNIRSFCGGPPILSWAIALAKSSSIFSRVVVTTDNDEIAEVADKYGADVFLRRKDDGKRGTQAVAAEVLRWINDEYACVLYPICPLLERADLHYGFREVQRAHFVFAMAVGADPLRDAGAMYWGRRVAFLQALPLISHHTAMVVLPEERVCDVNTIDDWLELERKYKALHPEVA